MAQPRIHRDPVAGQPVYCTFDPSGRLTGAHFQKGHEGAVEIGWGPWNRFLELQPRVRYAGGTGEDAVFEVQERTPTPPGERARRWYQKRHAIELRLLAKLHGKTDEEVLELLAEAAEEVQG